MPKNCCVDSSVIASAAKQSRGHSTRPLDCFVARAPRNDGQWWCSRSPSRLSYFWAFALSPLLTLARWRTTCHRMVTNDMKSRAARDSRATRERILDALGTMVMRDGLASIGVNALAREVGCDKVLIYRYFGDLDGVFSGFAARGDFWWSVEELTGGIDPSRMPLADGL